MADETKLPLRALGLVCSLKPSPAPSSSALMAEHVAGELRGRDVECELIRCVDHAIAPGVENDMGPGDEWPQIRRKALNADILLISTPIWLGHPSSIAQHVLERLDAELSTTAAAARNAAHLARLLRQRQYPRMTRKRLCSTRFRGRAKTATSRD